MLGTSSRWTVTVCATKVKVQDAALYPKERPGTHFTGGWVGPRAGLDGQKISSPPGFDPGLSSV